MVLGRSRAMVTSGEGTVDWRAMPNWAEQVTAIATAVGAVGLLSAIGAVVFAARQAREARISRQVEVGVEFIRRWNEGPLVETRRLVAQYKTAEALRDAMMRFITENSVDAYVLYRELDYFEQLGALEKLGVSISSWSGSFSAHASLSGGSCGSRPSTRSEGQAPTRCSSGW
jgi:hypothetical protein